MKTVSLSFSFDSNFNLELFVNWVRKYRNTCGLSPFPEDFFYGADEFFYCEFRVVVPENHAGAVKLAALDFEGNYLG